MINSSNNSIIYTPGYLFRDLQADATLKNLFGEHCTHYQTVADSCSFFSGIKIFGLESSLGTEDSEGGYYFPITCEQLAHLTEQIQDKKSTFGENIANDPVWQQVISFSNKWAKDELLKSELHHRLWFEMDVCGLPPKLPVPNIFFRTPGDDNSVKAVLDGLKAFSFNLPVMQQELLVKALRALAPTCSFLEIGLLLARPHSPIRLNAFHLALPDILKTLQLLEINTLEDNPDFLQELYSWGPYVRAVNLDIDTSNFGAKVGINFSDPVAVTIRQQQQSEFWPNFLEWLVNKGLCLSHKKQAVLNWSGGHKHCPEPYNFTVESKAILRTFNHVKLDFRLNQAPRAKVYLVYWLK